MNARTRSPRSIAERNVTDETTVGAVPAVACRSTTRLSVTQRLSDAL